MQWPSPDQLAAKRPTLERFDNFSGLRGALKQIAGDRDHWAGIPMPLDDQSLVIEPRYPMAQELMLIGKKKPEPPSSEEIALDTSKIRNVFYSTRWRCDIVIYEKDGKIGWGLLPRVHHFKHDLATLGCSFAWGIEQEHNALQLLGTLVKHHTFKQYLLTGMFLETSPRSGLTYCFRKLRPTVVVDLRGEETTILCALCMHPIGYYEGSWAGAMCPTDDVIAMLMLMRGDEPMLWRRANQHCPSRPEAGL